MRKITVIGLTILVLLTLTSCGGTDQAAVEDQTTDIAQSDTTDSVDASGEETQSQEKSRDQLREDFADNALSEEMQLVVGTMMLEGTDLEVNASLAEALLPYWKLYLNMLGSDTASPEELAALISGIKDEMSPERINYISDLQLTQEDMFTAMSEFGVMDNMGPGLNAADDENRPDLQEGGMGPGGGGMGPGGGGGPGAGGEPPADGEGMLDPQGRQSSEDGGTDFRGPGGMGAGQNLEPFINALIGLLEGKLES